MEPRLAVTEHSDANIVMTALSKFATDRLSVARSLMRECDANGYGKTNPMHVECMDAFSDYMRACDLLAVATGEFIRTIR